AGARLPAPDEEALQPLQLLPGALVGLYAGALLQLLDNRVIGNILAPERALILLDDGVLVRHGPGNELAHQPRFSESCLRLDQHDRPLAAASLLPMQAALGELVVAAGERREAARAGRLESADPRYGAGEPPGALGREALQLAIAEVDEDEGVAADLSKTG